MYKKIKNSSFMNLIWFLLATLPFVLLLTYAIGFFNNEDLRTNEQDNYTLTLNSINGNTLKEEQNLLNGTGNNRNENGIFIPQYVEVNQAYRYTITNYYIPYNTNYLYIYTNSQITQLSGDKYELSVVINNENVEYELDLTTINNDYFYEYNIQNIRQELNHTTQTGINLTILFNKATNGELYIIASNNKQYFNTTWLQNYKTYINDFNSIKYNSCPISYTYNSNTYNIETNNNNYLGTNKTIEINQNFNYTLNEQPTLNYNNYFISNAIANTTQEIGVYKGDYIENASQYNFVNCRDMQFNENYYYYYYDDIDNTAELMTNITANNWNRNKNTLWIINIEQTTYKYEYYNIESTINTSLELIPNNNFNDFLTNINNTIKTNGFISNAFLNLASFFGVNNVYYSLACYYIEYLLVIILLHLAFDVLYIVPNICHKFMEKIGGERD